MKAIIDCLTRNVKSERVFLHTTNEPLFDRLARRVKSETSEIIGRT